MANKSSKHAFGAKANIETAKANKEIDEYDILYLDNGETGWIDKNGNTVIATPRTQSDIAVNGVTGLGIENGGTIPSGKSLDEIVKMLVQKAVPPAYTKPSVSIAKASAGTAGGNYETGTTINPVLTATFAKNDAGALTKLSVLKNNTEVGSATASPYAYAGESFILGDETVAYKAQATYGDGAVKNNNLGNPDATGQIKAGTVTSSVINYIGKRNAFYGTGAGEVPELTSDVIRGLANKKLAPANGTQFKINVAVGQQYIVFAYPATLRDVNQVKYEEANDASMATNFARSTINVADARGGENGTMAYKCYAYAMSIPAAAPMTFTVTI